jgi:hypothetical protein
MLTLLILLGCTSDGRRSARRRKRGTATPARVQIPAHGMKVASVGRPWSKRSYWLSGSPLVTVLWSVVAALVRAYVAPTPRLGYLTYAAIGRIAAVAFFVAFSKRRASLSLLAEAEADGLRARFTVTDDREWVAADGC